MWLTSPDYKKSDGWRGVIFSILFPTDTHYSNGYSEDKFNRIRIGMHMNQVVAILGEPLVRWKPYGYLTISEKVNIVNFQYSKSPSDTHYHLRQICFDGDTVIEIRAKFYVD